MNQKKKGRPRKDAEATRRFSENLKTALKNRNATTTQVAKALGISQPTVSFWTRGLTMPGEERINKLADYLKTTASKLRGEMIIQFQDDINASNPIDDALINKIADTFTEEECSMTVDALNGVRRGDGLSPVTHLVANVGWCINNEGVASKWDVEDPQGYIDKLNLLTEPEAEAFIALVIRFWNAPNFRIESVPVRLREVGLVRE